VEGACVICSDFPFFVSRSTFFGTFTDRKTDPADRQENESTALPDLSEATHLPEAGCGICTVQELLGQESVETAMVYTQVLNKGGQGVRSPLDRA